MDQKLKDKRINEVINLFTSGMLDACTIETQKLISLYYPQEPFLFNLLGFDLYLMILNYVGHFSPLRGSNRAYPISCQNGYKSDHAI